MISVRCRSCGRQYDYSEDDCCPRCGAYNRPPRHEQVNADGTVQHLTDAEFAGHGHAVLDKVCFEEKECYEDDARPKASRRKRGEKQTKGQRKAGLAAALTAMLVAFIIPSAVMLVSDVLSDRRSEEPFVLIEPEEWNEADANDEPYDVPQRFDAQDGSTFTLLGWWWEDGAIAVELDVDFAGSGHEFYASLDCVGENGYLITLKDFETEGNSDTTVLRFLAEDETLTPLSLVIEEWDDEDELVGSWQAYL